MTQTRPRVALFVTCLVDLYRPTVGFAAIKLLEEAGCLVEVPPSQTCCGQPAYNSGDRANAKALARAVVDAFQGYDYVVAPSGSCAGMIAHHYPALFDMEKVAARLDGSVTYHDSCSGLREMGVKAQPRKLLKTVEGLSLIELAEPEICCGFGGTFCVKYPDISVRMVTDKCRDVQATGAGTLLAGDMGCLLNMAGRLKREGSSVKVHHVAEVLAGMTRDAAPIGDAKKG